jgi:hypothetical protein
MLSATQSTQCRLLRLINELETMWKETAMACFKVRYRNSPMGTEENHEKPKSSILGVPAEIRTRNFSNTSQKHYRLRYLTRPHYKKREPQYNL